MARSRNIKPGAAKNEFLAQCSHAARLLFVLLPTIADREGRLEDRPLRIKGELFPYEQIDINALLEELATLHDGQDHPFVVRYEVKGVKYLQIVKFLENQNPHKDERASEIPPPKHYRTTIEAPCNNDAPHCEGTEPASDAGLKESEKRESVTGNQNQGELEQCQAKVTQFDLFWEVVHQKVAKRQSQTAYKNAVKRVKVERPGCNPHEFLRERMAEFAKTPAANPKDRTPIYPSTWLNNGRYDDDPSTWCRGSPAGSEDDPRGTALAVRDYLYDA